MGVKSQIFPTFSRKCKAIQAFKSETPSKSYIREKFQTVFNSFFPFQMSNLTKKGIQKCKKFKKESRSSQNSAFKVHKSRVSKKKLSWRPHEQGAGL